MECPLAKNITLLSLTLHCHACLLPCGFYKHHNDKVATIELYRYHQMGPASNLSSRVDSVAGFCLVGEFKSNIYIWKRFMLQWLKDIIEE